MEVLAPIKRIRERRALASARRVADDELVRTRLPSPRLAWRTQELLDERHRRELAGAIIDLLHGSDARFLPGASPLNRAATRHESDLLLRLAATLADGERRVPPRGVVLVERLLADPRSPFWARDDRNRLHAVLRETIEVLEDTR